MEHASGADGARGAAVSLNAANIWVCPNCKWGRDQPLVLQRFPNGPGGQIKAALDYRHCDNCNGVAIVGFPIPLAAFDVVPAIMGSLRNTN